MKEVIKMLFQKNKGKLVLTVLLMFKELINKAIDKYVDEHDDDPILTPKGQ